MKRQKELFWQGGADEQFYNQYESLVDAVSSEEGNEIFEAKLTSLGSYRLVTKMVKEKKSKKAE